MHRRRPRLTKIESRVVTAKLVFAACALLGGLGLCACGQTVGGCLAFITALAFAYLAYWGCRFRGEMERQPLRWLADVIQAVRRR